MRPISAAAYPSSAALAHGAQAGLRASPGPMLIQPGAVAAMPPSGDAYPAAAGAGSPAPFTSVSAELARLDAVRSDIASGRDVPSQLDRIYESVSPRGGADLTAGYPDPDPAPRPRELEAELAVRYPLFTSEDVNERVAWAAARPQAQVRIIDHGGIMYSIDRSGMPEDAQVIELQAPMALYHLASAGSADLFVREQRMICGHSPYTNALHAGSEMIYTNYLDLTGLFFTDRAIPGDERGYIGASGVEALIRVIVPAGLRILKLSSMKEHIPFYLILMPPGRSFELKIERS
ncbi:MAG: hypothetical protein WC881_03270 [Elusimicrobiota bacterium]